MPTPVTIDYNGKALELDLDGYTPGSILESNYKGEKYISITVVREIARAMGRHIHEISVSHEKINDDNLMMQAAVYIKLNDTEYLTGVANDIYGIKGLSRSCFPNAARMQALAIKNALKRKYKIFEGDYLTEEQMAEKKGVQAERSSNAPSPFASLKAAIEGAAPTAMAPIMQQIVAASGAGLLKPEEAKELRKMYNDKVATPA